MFRVLVVIGGLLQTTESKRRIFTRNEFSTKYDNILLMDDFNLTIKNKHLEELHVSSPQSLRVLTSY